MRSLQDHFLDRDARDGRSQFQRDRHVPLQARCEGALGVIINRPERHVARRACFAQLAHRADSIARTRARRAARRPRRAGARLRAASLEATVRRDPGRRRRHQGDAVDRHPGRGRARREPGARTSSRSATPAGTAASSRRSCCANAWLTVAADPAVDFRHAVRAALDSGRRVARRRHPSDHELCRTRLSSGKGRRRGTR